MNRFIRLFLFSIISSFLISNALGQDFSRRFSISMQGGFWKSGLSERSDIYKVGNQGGLSFRYDLNEKFSLGLSPAYAQTEEADLTNKLSNGAGFTFSQRENANQFTQVWLDASLCYHFRPWEKLNPYILGGWGIVFWNVKDKDGEFAKFQGIDLKDQELTILGGGGLEYRFKEKWGVNLGTRFHYLTHVFSKFKGSKDVVGAAPDELDLPKATLEIFLGFTYYLGGLRDSDRDGVPDNEDLCADTPVGASVDEKGCPLDSDEDGIYDGLDKCPHTPPKTKVDVNGCPF